LAQRNDLNRDLIALGFPMPPAGQPHEGTREDVPDDREKFVGRTTISLGRQAQSGV
jgi:hypothetical protein